MISCRSMFRVVLVTLVVGMLAACVRQDSTDYCDNHYFYHESHVDNVGSLQITHSDDGRVDIIFSLPKSLIGRRSDPASPSEEQLIEILSDRDNVFAIQSVSDCKATDGNVTSDDVNLTVGFHMDCNPETKIGQIDVRVFDVLPEVDEIVVQVTTPATGKYFAISRQCDSAIFRLQSRSDR